MANPFDQFDSSASSSGGNPFDQFDAKGGSAKTVQPSDNDYSNSPLSAIGRTFESSADWGTGDLIRAAMSGKKPSETAAQSSAAAASLPWYIRYPTEAAGYGAGLVNLLDPVTDAAEAAALGLGAGAKLAKVAGTAAEGATVAGVSHVAGSDDPGLTDTGAAMLGGGALGGAAGAAAPLINKGLTKFLGKAPSVDPTAAQTQTTAASDTAYAALHKIPVSPMTVGNSINTGMTNLSSSQRTGLSPGFKNQVNDIQNELQNHLYNQTQPTLGDVNSWKRQIAAAASTQIDGGVANTIGKGLDNVMDAQAPGLNQAAQAAYQKSVMAQKLGGWQQTIGAGGSIGQQPLTEAQNFYSDPANKASFDTLAGLSGAGSGGGGHLGWVLPHMAATGLSFAGEHLLGIPGAIAGEIGGYIGAKNLLKGYNKRQGVAGLQAAYPQLTGVQPTGGRTGPQLPQGAGNLIKNLMLGGLAS